MTKIDDGSIGNNAWSDHQAWSFFRGHNGSRTLFHCDHDWVRGEKAVREIAYDRGWGGMVIAERTVLGKVETKWVFLDRPSDEYNNEETTWVTKWDAKMLYPLSPGDAPDSKYAHWPELAKSAYEEGKMFGPDHLHAPVNIDFPGERLEKWAFIRGCEEYGKE